MNINLYNFFVMYEAIQNNLTEMLMGSMQHTAVQGYIVLHSSLVHNCRIWIDFDII